MHFLRRLLAGVTTMASALAAAGALAAQPSSVLVLVTEFQAANIESVRESYERELRERGVGDADIASMQFRVQSQEPAALAELAQHLRRDSARVVYVPTYVMLRHLLPLTDRPPLVFIADVGDLLGSLPQLTDVERARATGVNVWGRTEYKMLELLQLATPALRTACALTSDVTIREDGLRSLARASASMSVRLRIIAVDSVASLEKLAVRELDSCDGFLVFVHPPLMRDPARYIRVLNESGRPAVYTARDLSRFGALVAIEPKLRELRAYVFDQLAAILGGAPLRKLPITSPDNYEVILNVRAIRALAHRPDKRLLLRATELSYD